MLAKWIFAALSAMYIAAASTHLVRDRGRVGPAAKTWLIVGGLFALVSAWLWTTPG